MRQVNFSLGPTQASQYLLHKFCPDHQLGLAGLLISNFEYPPILVQVHFDPVVDASNNDCKPFLVVLPLAFLYLYFICNFEDSVTSAQVEARAGHGAASAPL